MLTPDRWTLVERIFYQALERPDRDRAAFLDERCGADVELRREVDSLLHSDSTDDWKPTVAHAAAAGWALGDQPSILGRVVDGFRIDRRLAAGGMGEVFLAEQLSLGRTVALKLLPSPHAADPERLRRFADEARAASALNHPGIVTVHHVGQLDGRPFIVTEFVEGETVRERLRAGPLPSPEAVRIALQIADALAAAHDAGIVHRDIKPENVIVRRDGLVKVLDFGLAKLRRTTDRGSAATLTGTRAGAVVGTIDYMAPEQAAGARVDARADIFSLGVVLHEMLTGSLPRELGSGSSGSGRGGLRRDMRATLRRALATDPAARFQSAREFARALAPLGRAWWKRTDILVRAAAAVVAIATAGIAGTAWWHSRHRSTDVASLLVMPVRSLVPDPSQSYLEAGLGEAITTRLSGLPHLRVSPPTAARTGEDPFDAAARLGVDALLIETVQRQGEELRVTAQLLRAADRSQIWASRFDQRFTDIFTVEDTIAERIATNLQPTVSADDRSALTRRETHSVEAYDLYLRAREQWARRTVEGIHLAIQMYQHAIELDPDFSLAYTGLADCYNLTASGLTPAVRFPLAKAAAARAIELDPRSGPAHTAHAFMLYKFEWKWRESEQEFRRAIELDPNYALAHHWFGEALKLQMRHDESIAELERAMALDPFSIAVRYDYVLALLNAGRVAQARALLDDSVKLDPTNGRLMLVAFQVLRAEGRMPEAIEMRLQAALIGGTPEADVAALRAAFAGGGYDAYQRLEIEHTLRHAVVGVDPGATAGLASSLAQGYADLHDRDQTMRYLLEAADKDEDAPLLMKTPMFDFLRDDARFRALESRVFAQ